MLENADLVDFFRCDGNNYKELNYCFLMTQLPQWFLSGLKTSQILLIQGGAEWRREAEELNDRLQSPGIEKNVAPRPRLSSYPDLYN